MTTVSVVADHPERLGDFGAVADPGGLRARPIRVATMSEWTRPVSMPTLTC